MADGLRILLAAHPGRKAYENRLQGQGWHVNVVPTLSQARTSLGEVGYAQTPDIDLVVTDFGHKNAMGPELTRWVREHERLGEFPILGVALEDRDDTFLAALRAGVTDFLAMPFTADEAVAKVERLRAGEGHTMADLYGESDPAELRRLSQAAAPDGQPGDDGDAEATAHTGQLERIRGEIRTRMEKAERSLRAQEATRTRRLMERLPDALAAEFADRDLTAQNEVRRLEEAYRQAERRSELKPAVSQYDFKHPARMNKTQLRALESLHEVYARKLSAALSWHMRAVVNVDVAFVDQTSYGEFIASLSNPSVSYQFLVSTMGPAPVVLDVAMPLVWGFVDRAHGGKGSATGLESRQITQIEMGIVNRIAKSSIDELEEIWGSVLGPTDIHDIELETNPEFIQVVPKNEIVALIAFEINSTNASGLFSLCFPFFTLEPVLPVLGSQQISYSSRVRQRARPRLENRLRLGGMRVPAVVEVGRTRMEAGAARGLRVGDVIRLDAEADDPARVYVGGKPKFLGWPLTDEKGGVGVQLAGLIPPELQGKYGEVDRRLDSQ